MMGGRIVVEAAPKVALVGASAAGGITGAAVGGPPGARWLVQWGGRHLHQVALSRGRLVACHLCLVRALHGHVLEKGIGNGLDKHTNSCIQSRQFY